MKGFKIESLQMKATPFVPYMGSRFVCCTNCHNHWREDQMVYSEILFSRNSARPDYNACEKCYDPETKTWLSGTQLKISALFAGLKP